MMRSFIVTIFLTCLYMQPLFADDNDHIVRFLNPEQAPIAVEDVKWGYSKLTEMYYVDITWSNNSNIKTKFVSFRIPIFNAVYGYMWTKIYIPPNPQKVDPGKQTKITYRYPKNIDIYGAYHFYVIPERVVFEDGTVWQREDQSVFSRLVSEMAIDISAEDLAKEKGYTEHPDEKDYYMRKTVKPR